MPLEDENMKQVYVEHHGLVRLTPRDYLASGGEADLYLKDGRVLKIYHDPKRMISESKIKELSRITCDQVITPRSVIFQKDSRSPLGFTMAFVAAGFPLVKLFNKSFKRQHGLKVDHITQLAARIREVVRHIHSAGCLVVDMNELNLLVGSDFQTPWFIDTDSYQTPSHPATAIAESIRDRRSRPGVFSKETDWYAFAIIVFQLYIGIHPFKGGHPGYKPNEWAKRMEDGVSVLDVRATLPPSCESFSVIPKPVRDWFEAVFSNRERSEPPVGRAGPPVPVKTGPPQVSTGHHALSTRVIFTCPDEILRVFAFHGDLYWVTSDGLYRNGKYLTGGIPGSRTAVTLTQRGTPVLGFHDQERLVFRTLGGEEIGEAPAPGFFQRGGLFYTAGGHHLMEHQFLEMGGRLIRKSRIAGNLGGASTRVLDGVLFQHLLGRTWILLPFPPGRAIAKHVPELDGFRILDARSERYLCLVLAEQGGDYFRFTLTIEEKPDKVRVSVQPGDYSPPNLAELANGIRVRMDGDDQLTIFTDPGREQRYRDPPLDSSMRLFSQENSVCFIRGRQICRLTTNLLCAAAHNKFVVMTVDLRL